MKKYLFLLSFVFAFMFLPSSTALAGVVIGSPVCAEWNFLQAGWSCFATQIDGSTGSSNGAYLHRAASGGTPILEPNTEYGIRFNYNISAGTGRAYLGDDPTPFVTGLSGTGTYVGSSTSISTNDDQDFIFAADAGGGTLNYSGLVISDNEPDPLPPPATTTVYVISNPNQDYFNGVLLFFLLCGGVLFVFKRR